MGDADLHLDPECAQVIRHQLGGANLAVAELRVLVNVTPPGDDLGLDRRDARLQLAAQWGLRLRRRAESGGQRRERKEDRRCAPDHCPPPYEWHCTVTRL